jgi:spoIIIJ-associated protein
MEWLEGEGKTEDEAVEDAMRKLGVSSRDEVRVEVIGEERKLFGFGEKRVKVKVALNESSVKTSEEKVSESINILQKLLNGMGIDAKVEGNEKGDNIYLNIFSEVGGILIGRRGETLDSLEHLVDRLINRKFQERVNIVIDTENYRERRREKLDRLAKGLARQVMTTGRRAVIPSMTTRDRKIIHMALQNDSSVETISEGEGFDRKVVISPKKTRY